MRVCVVGSGGREHALALALARSPSARSVVVSPGNPGMRVGPVPVECVGGPPEAVGADLFVIGPEAPLVSGLADRLRAAGRLVLGPGADGARLEGSKAWMKQLLGEAGVPTAAHGTFDRPGPAIELLRSLPPPWVVKTDGLAAGKGVLVTSDLDEAEADVHAKLSGRAFGDAGRCVVVEEGLVGPEVSVMALCDGSRAVPLAPARDHKRAGDGDTGPNTGGMGAYSPVPDAGPQLVELVMEVAVRPTLAALLARGIDYRGVLYAGLMLTASGPKVIEYNVRFGDPEAQVVAARWEGDVAAALAAAASGELDSVDPPSFSDGAAVCVVVAAAGYPEAPRTGDPLPGDRLAAATRLPGVTVLAAGVGAAGMGAAGAAGGAGAAGAAGGAGAAAAAGGVGTRAGGRSSLQLQTVGGRVLGITGVGATLAAARERAYAGVEAVAWPGCRYRRDIAARA